MTVPVYMVELIHDFRKKMLLSKDQQMMIMRTNREFDDLN